MTLWSAISSYHQTHWSHTPAHCLVGAIFHKLPVKMNFTPWTMITMHYSTWSKYLDLPLDLDLQTIGKLIQSTKHYRAYKWLDKCIKPISQSIPQEFKVTRSIPYDPLTTLIPLDIHFGKNQAIVKFTQNWIDKLLADMESHHFLWPEECQMFMHVLIKNKAAIAFKDEHWGTLKETYFSPYKIPHIPHIPWQERNIHISPGLRDKVIDLLRLKIKARVYEPCQSPYWSQWFCTWIEAKQKLHIVHDLQPLNAISLKESSIPPNLDQFVDQFLSGKYFTVLNLYWGFNARKMDEASRDMTAFLNPLELLCITSLPTGFTNSPFEFQEYMVFMFQDEIVP